MADQTGRPGNPREFLTAEEQEAVRAAIERCEKGTSAELKVVLARHCWGDLRARAKKLFEGFGLDKTAERNCAMILLVVTNRQFLIYGDQGIHDKVGQGFWDDARDAMMERFREGAIGAGLCAGIERIGEKLAAHYPIQAGDRNEVSNDIAYA